LISSGFSRILIVAWLMLNTQSDHRTSHGYRFGAFELDLRAARLKKHGVRVRLSKLPFQALRFLVENPRRLVGRDELKRRLWRNDAGEGFDDNLNHVIQNIREALDDDAKDPRFIETAPSMGYRFIAEVSAVPALARGAHQEAANRADASRRVSSLSWTLVALVLVAGPTIWAVWPSAETTEAKTSRPSIVVLPFENLGNPEAEYFADGMTEEVTSRLASLEGLGVISRTSAMQYKGARPSLKQIGEELGVDYVLEGAVRWQRSSSGPGRVRVTPQLIQVSEGTQLWAGRYDNVLTDIFEVQSDIAKRVVTELDVTLLEPQLRTLESRPTESLEAYDAYLRGNEYFHRAEQLQSKDDALIAVRMYERATEIAPNFALAHARQGVAHGWLFSWQADRTEQRLNLAKATTHRASALDPELPDVHLALGLIHTAGDDWNSALEEYQAALRSRPNDLEITVNVAEFQWMIGRWEESLATLEAAIDLNPRDGKLACWAGGRCFGLRDYSRALEFHTRAIELVPDRNCMYWCTALIHLNQDGNTQRARSFLEQLPPTVNLEGSPPPNHPWVLADLIDRRYEDALTRLSSEPESYDWITMHYPKDVLRAQIYGLMKRSDMERAHYHAARELLERKIAERPRDFRFRGSLGVAYAGLGRPDDAIREGKRGLELLSGRRHPSYGFLVKDMAQIYTMLGKFDEAIDQLEQLLSVPSFFSAAFLNADPTWEPLHDHPRFRALLISNDKIAHP